MPNPPSDFNLDRAREMILEGRAPPVTWRPWIKELRLGESAIEDLAPLAGHASPPIACRSRFVSGSRLRRGNLRDGEQPRGRPLQAGHVYREWMDLRLTPKGSTMDISTLLVFIIGLGAMLAAELAP